MKVKNVCVFCEITESVVWWKCCPVHVTEQGPDIVCQPCAIRIHSEEFLGIEPIQLGHIPQTKDLSDLVCRLREAADPSIYDDTPWWWDCPERGGPAQLLREAADVIEERMNDLG